jgi:hypothetical protein
METGLSGFHVGAPNGGLTNGKKQSVSNQIPALKYQIPTVSRCVHPFSQGEKKKNLHRSQDLLAVGTEAAGTH